MRHLILPTLGLLLLGSAHAEKTYVELVLDASGSMYSRLEGGQYRIAAAKDVLSDFISRLPENPDLEVGLRVYGARTDATAAGACQDSHLEVPLKGLDRTALLNTVRSATPRGATPIVYSLQKAVEDFPKEGRKLIVLVTDGEESCGGKVDAVLEAMRARGIEVDVRIVGFDLRPGAAKSFEGLGRFENAKSAAELAAALGRAVADVAAPQQQRVGATVALTVRGQPAPAGATVRFEPALGGEAVEFSPAAQPGSFAAQLAPGAYLARVQAPGVAAQTFGGLEVVVGGANAFRFEVASEQPVKVEVSPTDPVAGGKVKVRYSEAPGGKGHYLTVVPKDAPDTLYLSWDRAEATSGEVELTVPDETVPLEARFHLALPAGGTRVTGRSAPFSAKKVTARVTAPAEAPANTEIEVRWEGPNNDTDYITVVPEGAPEGTYLDYAYTREGNPVKLRLPVGAGRYEVRYTSDRNPTVQARTTVVAKASTYALEAPAQVQGGSEVEVRWTGPNNTGDYITVVKAGAPVGSYLDYAYTREGNPVKVRVPLAPGNYEIRYSSEAGSPNPTLASRPLEVTAVSVTLKAPASVRAKESFEVSWTGPNGPGDYITIVPVGARDGTYLDYAYTREGSTVTLTAPEQPGQYEVRYASEGTQGTYGRVAIEVK
ncbi:Ca-activated chloride channel family protein [Deinobacterium chartae]|uniref:Ca-activated chloride channel family protein n=1 Tax=Deinobacterium chartae TaxID=521158 RepID=A0A841I7A9_9DEIO|nr:VWA domain-containing protein [Deinobacterium chartae]MBB6100099.1 Ca-activated chloride channel family protein [Deinobacterium chartae]